MSSHDFSKINIGLPYVRGTSEALHRIFRKHGVNMYHRPYNSVKQQVTHVKDKTDKLKKCGVIYHIKCDNCDSDYIGETSRSLDTRLKEHQARANSAIFEHCDATGHTISPDNTKVLLSEDHNLKRKMREAISIQKKKPTLNRDEGLELPTIYRSLLLPRGVAHGKQKC